jgi:hypothetical protein
MTNTTCSICEKEVENQGMYCPGHARAYSLILRKYPEWKSAYEDISWERYLERILTLKETGDLAKAVAAEELRRYKAPDNDHASNQKLRTFGN